MFSFEQSIGTGFRCSNDVEVQKMYTSSSVSLTNFTAFIAMYQRHTQIWLYLFLAKINFLMTKLCLHLWLLPQSYSRAKFELLPKCLQFTKLAHSITRDTSHDDRLATLYRSPASPSVHCVGKTYLACICWNLRCYFTVLNLIIEGITSDMQLSLLTN